MVENWWFMGAELKRLELNSGRPMGNSPQGDHLTLAELGVNKNQSTRCQKLAEMSQAELTEWLQSKYDESSYYLPSLRPASEHVHVGENTGAVEFLLKILQRELIHSRFAVLASYQFTLAWV